jgi:Mrp family chromosome partitioning ATPase
MTTSTKHYRIDPHDTVMPPAPHHKTEAAKSEQPPARQTNQFATSQEDVSAKQNVAPGIRPQWEVDRFRWPVVCDVLRDTSAHRLEDVVESLNAQTQRGDRIVAVTSFDRHEGRSTIAMCLARLAAKSKRNVALVDGDLDHPSIGQYLGVAFDTSWNRLDAKLPLGEAGIVSIDDQFVVFPANQDSAFPEREVRTHSGPLLATLSEAFELVFVDIGPMYTAAHRWLMPESRDLIKSALVVRDVRQTTMDQVDDVCCRLVKSGVQNMAIIDNFQGLDD